VVLTRDEVKAVLAGLDGDEWLTPHPAPRARTHLLEAGYDIRTIQELLGHKDVSTTMIYMQVLNLGGQGVRSPIDGR